MNATAFQTKLSLSIADPVRLVSLETARAARGTDAESVLNDITCGVIPFAYDLGTGDRKRLVRVWAGCFDPSVASASWSHEAVIANILGTTVEHLLAPENAGFTLTGSQLETRWCVSNNLINELVRNEALRGLKVGKTTKVYRVSAAAWLRARRITD